MDILTHALSGIAAGTVVSSFSDKKLTNKLKIVAISGIGGTLPDLDAISLWSKFDSTFGKLFGLQHTGKEIYFSKFWYSHHGFMHSFIAGIIIALVFGILFYIVKSKIKHLRLHTTINFFKKIDSILPVLFQDLPFIYLKIYLLRVEYGVE